MSSDVEQGVQDWRAMFSKLREPEVDEDRGNKQRGSEGEAIGVGVSSAGPSKGPAVGLLLL